MPPIKVRAWATMGDRSGWVIHVKQGVGPVVPGALTQAVGLTRGAPQRPAPEAGADDEAPIVRQAGQHVRLVASVRRVHAEVTAGVSSVDQARHLSC